MMMKYRFRTASAPALLLALLSFPFAAPLCAISEKKTAAASLESRYRNSGPHEVLTLSEEWHDTDRDREVPVKIYYPKRDDGKPSPIIVFSHGLGGSRDGYAHLGNHWASHGYVSVHLQHRGSDDSVWKDVPRQERMQAMKSAANLRASLDRPADVTFAIDQLEERNATDGPLRGLLDLNRIGVSGHSFGARTTLMIAGQVFPMPGGREVSYRDSRVIAALPMSPMPPKNEAQHPIAFSKIDIPVMHMTGTRDKSMIDADRAPEERQLPYRLMEGPGQFLIVLNDGDHMVFSGRPRNFGNSENDAAYQELIRLSATAFWDAFLKKDQKAAKFLTDKGLGAVLGESALFNSK